MEWEDDVTTCPVCSNVLVNRDTKGSWVMIGSAVDKLSADFAREVLSSCDIPAVIISKSGFFGQVGLIFNTFYKPGASLFEISVPVEHAAAAADTLDATIGEKWQRKNS